MSSTHKRAFNGSTSYVRANSTALARYKNNNALTFAFWFKDYPTASGTDIVFQVYRNSTSTSANWFKAEIDGSGNLIAYGRRLFADGDKTVTSTGVNLRDGNWHRCVIVYDFDTPLFSIYIDSVLNVSDGTGLTAGLTENTASSRFEVGIASSSAIRGYLFDFQSWDIAFSNEHVIWDYANVLGLATEAFNSPYGSKKSNLIIRYKFNEVIGTPLDYSGNGFTPTTSGTSVISPVASPTVGIYAWGIINFPVFTSGGIAPDGVEAVGDVTFEAPTTEDSADVNLVNSQGSVVFPAPEVSATATVGTIAIGNVVFPVPVAAGIAPRGVDAVGDVIFPPPESTTTAGTNRKVFEQGAAFQGMPFLEQVTTLVGDSSVDRMVVLKSKTQELRQAVLNAQASRGRSVSAKLRCGTSQNLERGSLLKGRHILDVPATMRSIANNRFFAGLRCDDGSRPVVEIEDLKLRDSSIYTSPSGLFVLQVVFGDYSSEGVTLKLIDRDAGIWLVSDSKILELTEVSVGGIPISGYEFLPAYIDSTGRQQAAVRIFASPGNSEVTAKCKGVPFFDGTLRENPADILRYILEEIQGYSYEYIDQQSFGQYRSSCLRDNIKLRLVLNTKTTVKTLIKTFAINTNAAHTRDGGKHGLRRLEGSI